MASAEHGHPASRWPWVTRRASARSARIQSTHSLPIDCQHRAAAASGQVAPDARSISRRINRPSV